MSPYKTPLFLVTMQMIDKNIYILDHRYTLLLRVELQFIGGGLSRYMPNKLRKILWAPFQSKNWLSVYMMVGRPFFHNGNFYAGYTTLYHWTSPWFQQQRDESLWGIELYLRCTLLLLKSKWHNKISCQEHIEFRFLSTPCVYMIMSAIQFHNISN